jgi:hypothetical protein
MPFLASVEMPVVSQYFCPGRLNFFLNLFVQGQGRGNQVGFESRTSRDDFPSL